jgi:hypothetical protein
MKIHVFVAALVVALASGSALAQTKKPLTAAEMQALLKNGITVTTMDLNGGKDFTGTVTLASNGRLSGSLTPVGHSAIALQGTWRLDGARLCRNIQPIDTSETCETWLRASPKEAIVQVDGKEVSINRWP